MTGCLRAPAVLPRVQVGSHENGAPRQRGLAANEGEAERTKVEPRSGLP